MFGVVYKITNKVNGKIYIGQTIQSLKRRWICHCKDAKRNDDGLLHKAINQYGKENFVIEKIDEGNNFEELGILERKWIEYFHSNNHEIGYNIMVGGSHMNENTIQKMKDSHAGLHHSEKTKQIIANMNTGSGNPFFGKRHSEETKQKIRDKFKEIGKTIPKEVRMLGSMKRAKKVKCVETNEVFNTIKEAINKTGICYCAIVYSCKTGKPIRGHQMRFEFI